MYVEIKFLSVYIIFFKCWGHEARICLISGRCPVAVITNVDFPDRQRIDKLRSTLKVKGISKIFEVANICSDNTTIEIVYQHSLLSLLDRCMTDGDQAAVFKHHQHKEQMATRAAGKKYF